MIGFDDLRALLKMTLIMGSASKSGTYVCLTFKDTTRFGNR